MAKVKSLKRRGKNRQQIFTVVWLVALTIVSVALLYYIRLVDDRFSWQIAKLQWDSSRFRINKRMNASGSEMETVAEEIRERVGVEKGAEMLLKSSDEAKIGVNPRLEKIFALKLTEIDELLNGNDTNVLLAQEKLNKLTETHPETFEIIWRKSQLYFQLHEMAETLEEKVKYLEEGNIKLKFLIDPMDLTRLHYAELAIEIRSDAVEGYEYYLYNAGGFTELTALGNKKIIEYSKRSQVKLRVVMDKWPEHYVGIWSTAVVFMKAAACSWIEKRAASLLFDFEVPEGTWREAIEWLLRSEPIVPERLRKRNRLFLGKSYLQVSDYKNAHVWLLKADALPVISARERNDQKEIDDLLMDNRKHWLKY